MPNFFDNEGEIEITTNNLPHWDQNETWVFITWRLADSLPREVLKQWRNERIEFEKIYPKPWDDDTLILHRKTFTDRQEQWLDRSHGLCELKDSKIRKIVADAFEFFHGKRYTLDSYVIMPNHVHLLLRIHPDHQLPGIIHSLKIFTSQKISPLREADGPFWMEDYHDRLIRSPKHLLWARRYIKNNPKNLPKAHYTLRAME